MDDVRCTASTQCMMGLPHDEFNLFSEVCYVVVRRPAGCYPQSLAQGGLNMKCDVIKKRVAYMII